MRSLLEAKWKFLIELLNNISEKRKGCDCVFVPEVLFICEDKFLLH
jgi:hypothetical protein